MKKIFIAAIMLLSMNLNLTYGQVVREGKTFKQMKKKKEVKADTLVTAYQFEDSKGVKYPIIINKSSGRCHIWKVSGKTGKLYKMYMKPEVAKEICRELSITYKEK